MFGRSADPKKNLTCKLCNIISKGKKENKQPPPPEESRSEVFKFEIFCYKWIERRRNSLKESTVVKYENTLKNHIVPFFGKYLLSEITDSKIEKFTFHLIQNEKLSPKTVRDALVTLKSILNYGKTQYNEDISGTKFIFPKEKKKEMRVLTVREQKEFVEYLLYDIDSCKFGVILALYTGLRIGEICALRWCDISLKDKVLKVQHTMQRIRDLEGSYEGRTKVIISDPKSDNSVRAIPLTGTLYELCVKFYCEDGECFVLTGKKKYMEPRALQYRFKKYTEDCDFEGVHFHSLRHTFATRCIEADFDVKTLSEILGHSSVKITLDRYVHSSIEQKRKNLEKLWQHC